MTISAVIATRNRPESLVRLYRALEKQPLEEILIVDAGDLLLSSADFPRATILRSAPSVCRQRNIGIRAARGEWILLLDDDVEPPHDYVEKLMRYTIDHADATIVTGNILDMHDGQWRPYPPKLDRKSFLYRSFFQLDLWGSYAHGLNGLTRAGWPKNIHFSSSVTRCKVYSLAASLIRKETLLKFPFDEQLDPHGYGDNYGVTVAIPEPYPIHVLAGVDVLHHRDPGNREDRSWSSYRRLLALAYFIRRIPEFNRTTYWWLIWSVFGLMGLHVYHLRMRSAIYTLRAWVRIVSGRLPYR